MKNNTTELVFILDRSGSMYHLTADTIGGFNSMLREQKAKPGAAFVTTVLFDTQLETVHDRLPISEVPELTEREYSTRGCTALLDAVGKTVKHIASIHCYARKEDVPENTIFVITTDGLENASCSFDAQTVKKLVRHEQEKYGWQFIFLGANIDAVETAASFGVRAENAVNYHADKTGTRAVYEAVNKAVSAVRMNEAPSCAWRESIDRDYNTRK